MKLNVKVFIVNLIYKCLQQIPVSEEVDGFLTKISVKLLSVDADVNIGVACSSSITYESQKDKRMKNQHSR